MVLRPSLLCLLLAAVSSCGRSVPYCSSDADCPSDSSCHLGLKACVKKGEEGSPGPVAFGLTLNPTELQVAQGADARTQAAVVRRAGDEGELTLALHNAPQGMTLDPVGVAVGATTASLNLRVLGGFPTGTYDVEVWATAGKEVQAAHLSVTVVYGSPLAVTISSPGQTAYTNGTVAFQVNVTGGIPDTMELLRDGVLLASLTPPYQYSWNTAGESEKEYAITARATRASVDSTSATTRVVVDRTPPALIATAPVAGATDVSVHSSVVLTFSEAIKASNVTDAAVRLISGTGTPIASTKGLSTDGRTLTLKPVTVPVAPISVSLEVTNALTDLAGNGSTQIRSTFKMPAMIALGAPISAEPGLTPAEHPTIKIMADGTPVVAFSEMSAGSKNVYVFKWADRWTQIGGPFSGMTGAATDTGPPSLSVAGSRIAIAWAESVWGYNSDVFAKELNNGVWSSMPTLPDQAASSMFPIVLQDNNSVRVSWFVNESQTSRTARWDRASPGWTDIADLTGIFPWARAMEGTASGPIYAAASLRYYLPTDVASREFSLQVLNGSTWTPVGTSIRPPDGYHVGKSSLSLTTQGIPIAAFTTADTTRAYVSMYKNVSGGWQRIGLDIPETVGREDDFSFLLINDLPALATTSLTTNDELISILKWDGAAIIPYETLNGNPLPNTPASNPSLAADVTGCLFATWAESSVVARDIFVYKCNR